MPCGLPATRVVAVAAKEEEGPLGVLPGPDALQGLHAEVLLEQVVQDDEPFQVATGIRQKRAAPPRSRPCGRALSAP